MQHEYYEDVRVIFLLIWFMTVILPISVEVYEKDFNNYFSLDLILFIIDLYPVP
jgi:hypothetical protein